MTNKAQLMTHASATAEATISAQCKATAFKLIWYSWFSRDVMNFTGSQPIFCLFPAHSATLISQGLMYL